MKKLIVFLQDRPTQFDVPFFSWNAAHGQAGVHVCYSAVQGEANARADHETGVAPQWDHLAAHGGASLSATFVKGWGLFRLVRYIVSLRPSLVIVSGYMPPLHAAVALILKLLGERVGLRSDNTLDHSRFSGWKGWAKRAMLPAWLRLYDTWHPVGTLATEYLQSLAGRSRPVYLFPYNVDNDWFARQSSMPYADRPRLRAELGLAPEHFVVLGVMKWHPREDPMTLLEAVSSLHARHGKVRLVLVGDGPLRAAVAARARDMEGVVVTPGYVPYSRLPSLYALADVFVHPAPGEPWGVSVNEAMACGLPVIAASGVGSARDLIVPGETGEVFASGDADDLARCLERLVIEPERRSRMGRAAQSRVGAHWCYERAAQVMNEAANASD